MLYYSQRLLLICTNAKEMKKYWIGGGVVVGVLALGLGWYALSPLFMNSRIDEALPITAVSKGAIKDTDAQQDSLDATDPNKKEGGINEAPTKEGGMTEAMPGGENSVSDPVTVVDTPTHPASGQVRVVQSSGKTYIRYENYKTINGPDVRVYLATDLAASEFVDLGLIKATEGNINYEVPAGTNLAEYPYVLTWCEDFGILFNSAKIR
jgi:hypothetical protein